MSLVKSRVKPIQVDQFQYSLQNASVEFRAYTISGMSYGSVMRAPMYNSLQRLGPQNHPSWGQMIEYGPAKPIGLVNGVYDTSYGFSQMMDSMTCKDADTYHGTDNPVHNSAGFSGQDDALGMAYFPVVYRLSAVHLRTSGVITNDYEKISVVPFRVIASTWPWINNQSGVDYSPNYRDFQLWREDVRMDIHVDSRYIADDGNSYMAILGSILTVLPGRWSGSIKDGALEIFLTIAPAVSDEDYNDHISACNEIMGDANAPMGDACFVFEGASLGMAVLAAIMGMPPIMYTGYNSQVGTDLILTDDVNSPIQQVALGANMVEPVDDIEYKTAAAIVMGVPLVIPLNVSWYTEPAQQAMYRGVSKALGIDSGRRTLIALASKRYGYPANMQKQIALATNSTNWAVQMKDFIFTTAKRAAGWNFDVLPSLILAAASLSDAQILAAHATAYLWGPDGTVLLHGGPDGTRSGQYQAQELTQEHHRVSRAEQLAKHAGRVNVRETQKMIRDRAQQQAFPGQMNTQFQNQWDYQDVNVNAVAKKKKAPAKKKAGAKKSAAGGAKGKVKPKRVGGKPKKSAAKKSKKHKKAGGKKKGGKKKAGAKKKKGGKNKKSSKKKSKKSKKLALLEAEVPKKKSKKGKKKGGKKKAGAKKSKKGKKAGAKPKKKKKSKSRKGKKPKKVDLAAGAARGLMRARGKAAGYPMDRRIGRQIPMLGLTRTSKDRALGEFGARHVVRSGNLTARQIMQQALSSARGNKYEKPVRFS
jgi:hypothetical protein